MTLIITIEWKSGEGSIIEFSDGSIVYFFFLIYSMALVVFLFTISTIFSNRKYIVVSDYTMYDFHNSTDTLKFGTEKQAINKTFLFFLRF